MKDIERRAVERLNKYVARFQIAGGFRTESAAYGFDDVVSALIAHDRDALERAAQLVESRRGDSIVTSSVRSIRVEWPKGMDTLLDIIAAEIRALKEEDSNVPS